MWTQTEVPGMGAYLRLQWGNLSKEHPTPILLLLLFSLTWLCNSRKKITPGLCSCPSPCTVRSFWDAAHCINHPCLLHYLLACPVHSMSHLAFWMQHKATVELFVKWFLPITREAGSSSFVEFFPYPLFFWWLTAFLLLEHSEESVSLPDITGDPVL